MNTMKSVALFLVAGIVVLSTAAPTSVVFQQGLNGYNGCTDNELRSPEQNYENGPINEKMEISEL